MSRSRRTLLLKTSLTPSDGNMESSSSMKTPPDQAWQRSASAWGTAIALCLSLEGVTQERLCISTKPICR